MTSSQETYALVEREIGRDRTVRAVSEDISLLQQEMMNRALEMAAKPGRTLSISSRASTVRKGFDKTSYALHECPPQEFAGQYFLRQLDLSGTELGLYYYAPPPPVVNSSWWSWGGNTAQSKPQAILDATWTITKVPHLYKPREQQEDRKIELTNLEISKPAPKPSKTASHAMLMDELRLAIREKVKLA